VDSGPQVQPPPPRPEAPRPEAQPSRSPLESINRQVNWALGLSVFSIFCGGIVFSVVALVLAFSAQAKARSFGVTSSDGKIKAAKWIAIAATVLWGLLFVVVIIAAANSGNSNNTSGA
jgi:hypothetical protein